MTRNRTEQGISNRGPSDSGEVPVQRTGGPIATLAAGWRVWDWFWFSPSLPHTLGIMRICAGLTALYVAFTYSFDLLEYVGPAGWMDDAAISKLRNESEIYAPPVGWFDGPPYARPTLLSRGRYLWSIYFHVHDPALIWAIHAGVMGAAILFTLGLWTRVTSVLTWMGALIYIQRAPTMLFGQDTILVVVLLYLALAPCGAAYSLDRWLAKRRARQAGDPDWNAEPTPTISAGFFTRMMQVHFCIIYLAAGTSKLLGSTWWNGTALWGVTANYEFNPIDFPLYYNGLVFLSQHRWLWEITFSGGVLFTFFTELGFPFLVWLPRWRWIMVSCSVLLHTGIGMIMGLTTFSLLMMILVMSFIPPEAIRHAVWRTSQTVSRLINGPGKARERTLATTAR